MIAALMAVVVLWVGWDLIKGPQEVADRGVPGIAFVIPGEYRTLELDQTTYRSAVERVLAEMEASPKVAAVFIDEGDRIQLLVNPEESMIEERIAGRNGTTWVVTWEGPVVERLEWAREHGNLETPGLPEPERRNPYH